MRTLGAILKRLILPLLGGLFFLNALQAQTPLTTQRIASGLRNAVWAGAPAGDDRIWVCQKNGAIRLVKNGQVSATNFMAINSQVSSASEQGLLGMAFHPDYANNGEFFLNYTRNDGATVVSRWGVDPADPDRGDRAR